MRLNGAHTGQKRSDTSYYLFLTRMNLSEVSQQMDLDRKRAAPMIVSALMGTVILTDVTQVFGRSRGEPGAWMPGAVPQMAPPSENRAQPGRSLVLTGIIAYTDPKQGFAIIGSSVRNTYLARPGQQLPDGSLIREIYPKHVVLEYGGRLETVGMHERGESAGTAYVQAPPPLPPQPRWDPKAIAAVDALANQAPRPTVDEPPSDPRPSNAKPSDPHPSDAKPGETTSNEHRSSDTQSSDAAQPKQAQPDAPSPSSAQDPADENGDDRLQRAENRRK